MSDFGDFTDDDALDTEPADPEQVAIKLHRLRRAADLSRRIDRHDWEDLDDDDRQKLIEMMARLLAWLRRQRIRSLMGIYYTDAVAVLEAAGVRTGENSINAGWQNRARSSGGFPSAPKGIVWHHTASKTSVSSDLSWMIDNCDDAPVGNMLLDREGIVWMIAAGASNCAGKGGPAQFSRGQVAQDSGNTGCWNIEVANNGVGEAWPQAQVDAYFKASNALNARFGNQPSDVITHNVWAPDRKIDPATAAAVQGSWHPGSVTSSGTWSLNDIKAECIARAGQPDDGGFDLSQQQYDEIMHQLKYMQGQLDAVAVNTYGNPDGVNPPYNASTWGRLDTVSRQTSDVNNQVTAALATLWGNTENPPYPLSVNGMLISICNLLGYNPWEASSDAQTLTVEPPPAGEAQTPGEQHARS